jgi:hypothetical protein
MLERALNQLKRLVRFLATCERPLLNQNLLILDLYTLFQYEMDRAMLRSRDNGREDSREQLSPTGSPRPRPVSLGSSASGAGGPRAQPAVGPAVLDPLFVYPQSRRRKDSSLRRAAQKQRGPFKLDVIHSPVSPWGHRRRSDGEYGWWSRSLKRYTLGEARAMQEAEADLKTKTLPSRLSLRNTASVAGVFRSAEEGCTRQPLTRAHSVERDLRDLPMSKRTLQMAEHLTSVASGQASASERELLGLKPPAPASSHAPGQTASREPGYYGGGDDAVILHQLWQCLFLVRRQAGTYSLAQTSLAELRESNRRALKQMSVHMRALRGRTMQALAAEFTYDELLAKAEALEKLPTGHDPQGAAGGGGRVTLLSERLRRLVYMLQVEDLIFTYSPHTGYRHIQKILRDDGTGASAGEAAPTSVLDRRRSASVPQVAPRGADWPGKSSTDNLWDGKGGPFLAPEMRALLRDVSLEPREKQVGGGSARRHQTLTSFVEGTAMATGDNTAASTGQASLKDFFARVASSVDSQEAAAPGGATGQATVTIPVLRPKTEESGQPKPKTVARGSSVSNLLNFFSRDSSKAPKGKMLPRSASQPDQHALLAREDRDPPAAPPLTLVCSKYLHFIPWEFTVGTETAMTRCLSLHSLVNTPVPLMRARARPSSVPQLFGYSWRGRESDVRAKQANVSSSALQRFLWEMKQHDPPFETPTVAWPPSRAGPTDEAQPKEGGRSGGGWEARLLRRVPRMISDDILTDVWPLTTPPLPLGNVPTSLSLKLSRKRHITSFDASQAGTNLFATLHWLDGYSSGGGSSPPLPVFILSYADLARLCDALLCLLCNRPDCVLVFVPPASADVLVREISARRDAVLSGKGGAGGSLRRESSFTSKRGGGEGGEGSQQRKRGSGGSNGENAVLPPRVRGGHCSYDILVSAVHAVRTKYNIPIVAFNL